MEQKGWLQFTLLTNLNLEDKRRVKILERRAK